MNVRDVYKAKWLCRVKHIVDNCGLSYLWIYRTLLFSKSEVGHTCKITVHGNTLEQVNRFVCLGSPFTPERRCEQDVQQRIAIAKSAFTSLEKVLKNRNINIQLRCRFLKCNVWSTLLYGSEAWTLSSKMLNKLESTEMWFLRRR